MKKLNDIKLSKNNKKIATYGLVGIIVVSSIAISAMTSISEAADATNITSNNNVILYDDKAELAAMAAKATELKAYTEYKTQDYQKVVLNGNFIEFEGTGATVNGSDLVISAAGTYVISGTLNDGAIIVDSDDTDNINLVLENANITCRDGAPIYVKNCGKNVVISLPNGTESTITDGENYTYEYVMQSQHEETGEATIEPSAAIFSKDDIRINGLGKLTVNANYNDGIAGKDDVEVLEVTLCINAKDDGIVGKDSVVIGSGDITIEAKGDGIKATNSEDSTKGYVAIADGNFNITSGRDGIQAETTLLTLGGAYNIKTGNGAEATKSSNTSGKENVTMEMPTGGQMPTDRQRPAEGQLPTDAQRPAANNTETQKANNTGTEQVSNNNEQTEQTSTKALKAGSKVLIQNGTFTINSQDDAIHSNDFVAVASGKMNITTGDDGIHADTELIIYGGDINITQSYEGIESAKITVQDGDIQIVSSDDGINVAGGNDNSGFSSGIKVDDFNTTSESINLYINGGTITVNANGDGIDVNGSAYMTQGYVMVNGPTNNGNGGLDYDGVFEVTGGTFLVAGSSGMAQSPNSKTTINTIATAVDTQSGGTEVKLLNSEGKTILSFTPKKQFSHIVISSPLIETGKSYTIMAGSTELLKFTAESTITNLSGNNVGGQAGRIKGTQQ